MTELAKGVLLNGRIDINERRNLSNSGVGTIVMFGGGAEARHQKTAHPELLPTQVLPYCYNTVICTLLLPTLL